MINSETGKAETNGSHTRENHYINSEQMMSVLKVKK